MTTTFADDQRQDEFSPPVHRMRIFALVLIGAFCGQMGLSIITPFFPKEAEEKGVSSDVLGWIFSIFELAVMAGAPLAIRFLVKVGSKTLLVSSNALGGVANILLGFNWFMQADKSFTFICFVLRILAGFAFAANSTSGYGLLPVLFGDKMSSASGAMEGANGLALILGPIVGSGLFSLGGGLDGLGFVMPFVVLGGIELLFAFFNATLLPNLPTPPAQQPSLTKFSWKVWIPVVNCVGIGVGLGFLGPTLEPHLSAPPLEFSIPMVGWAFSVSCLCYTLMAPIVGAIDDRFEGRFGVAIMAVGALLSSVGYALLAPLPLQIGGHMLIMRNWTCWTGMSVLGVGIAFGLIPVYKQIRFYARHDEAEQRDVATAALFTMTLSAGSFLGPTLGGMLSQMLGQQKAYCIVAVTLFALFVVLAVLSAFPAFKLASSGALLEDGVSPV